MSRRRSKNPTKAISITLPQRLLDEIEDELTRNDSRSKWIASACEAKLGAEGTLVQDATTKQLLTILYNRGDMMIGTYKAMLSNLGLN